jgi:hypothetical protein
MRGTDFHLTHAGFAAHRRRRRPGRPAQALTLALPLALAACASHQVSTERRLLVPELTSLAVGRTLHIVPVAGNYGADSPGPCGLTSVGCAPPRITTIYLAPQGGGWIDQQTQPGIPPQPGTMAMITRWRIGPPAELCLAAAPLIGDMPSGAPLRHECVSLATMNGNAWAPLIATVSQGPDAWKGYVAVAPGSTFPLALTEQYIDMVKVLFGHHIPRWGDS